ncbi:MAG: hypothetical protein WC505_04620 [Patescibacteria group bacterium]
MDLKTILNDKIQTYLSSTNGQYDGNVLQKMDAFISALERSARPEDGIGAFDELVETMSLQTADTVKKISDAIVLEMNSKRKRQLLSERASQEDNLHKTVVEIGINADEFTKQMG